jgi:hypothetical protein
MSATPRMKWLGASGRGEEDSTGQELYASEISQSIYYYWLSGLFLLLFFFFILSALFLFVSRSKDQKSG